MRYHRTMADPISRSDVKRWKDDTRGLDPHLRLLAGKGPSAIVDHYLEAYDRLGVRFHAGSKPPGVPKTRRMQHVYMARWPVLYLGRQHAGKTRWQLGRTYGHEIVHMRRQLGRYWNFHDARVKDRKGAARIVRAWVSRYLLERKYRMREEVIAVRNTVRVYRAQHPGDEAGARKVARHWCEGLIKYFWIKPRGRARERLISRAFEVAIERYRGI